MIILGFDGPQLQMGDNKSSCALFLGFIPNHCGNFVTGKLQCAASRKLLCADCIRTASDLTYH